MATNRLPTFDRLIDKLGSLPGVGEKTAQRLAYHILSMPEDRALAIAQAITDCREKIHFCPVCGNLTDQELCPMCQDPGRDRSIICVVEEPKDVAAFERTEKYKWMYHVLHGTISPLKGRAPDSLTVRELLDRAVPPVEEVIMALSPTPEGDATALYLSEHIKPTGIKVTRLAYGMPLGSRLEYTDAYTLQMALEGRQAI